ncbi:unnamed protein product [Caenorhabditis angaria]|uniref:DUF281 domain-containing protein n=1 Tax=Caenorhabditis angaria TaxID=860376 RepID=A0A9P1IBH1_9PELO|nr:unnamed protein product [Caenorhabditis angaria]
MPFLFIICLIPSILACGPGLLSDGEYVVSLNGVNLPFPFVYSTSNIDGLSTATSSGQAIQNINNYCQDLIDDLIRTSLNEIAYPAYLLEAAVSSLDVSLSSDYQPLECTYFNNLYVPGTTTTVKTTADDPVSAKNTCLYDTSMVVTKICHNKGTVTCTSADAIALPSNVSRINFDFTPGLLAAQPRTFWKNFSNSLAQKLKNGVYSTAFQQVSVDVKYKRN